MPIILKFLILLLCSFFFVHSSLAGNLFVGESNEILSVDEAFRISDVKVINNKSIRITINISEGHYLYKSKLEVIHPEKKISTINYPLSVIKNDEYFGEQEVYFNLLNLKVDFENNIDANEDIKLKFQGCSESGLCYPPTIRSLIKNDSSNFTGTNISKGKKADDNLFLILIGFLVSGILLSVTPCVLPMVPVLSGIILSSNKKSSRSLTLFYVLGICTTYSTLGVIAGITGTLLSSSIQNIGFLYFSGLLFILFGLFMLDIISLKLPVSLNNIVSRPLNKLKGGNQLSVFLMGLFSALILSPCVAPPLAAAIIYIGQSNDYILGGISLFIMAIGMSAPLLLIGFSSNAILPKPGVWMEFIKKIMGFIFFVMAIYIIRPVLSESNYFILLLFVLSLTLLFSLKHKFIYAQKNNKINVIIIFSYLLAASFLIQNIVTNYSSDNNKSDLAFHQVSNEKELAIRINMSDTKPKMLDFYADWCVACLEYEKYTFTDKKVNSQLKKFDLLKADVTENNNKHQELMKSYNLFGPPGIIFFDKQGNHLKQFDVIGYKDSNEFSKILEKVLIYEK